MAVSHKNCEHCGTLFVGRQQARYCSNHCRWKASSVRKYQEYKVAREKDPELSRRGRANRAKGARAENEVCHIIRDLTGDEVRRNLSQTRDAGGDVKWGPFYFEVKYQATIKMPAWQLQATQSAAQDGEGLIPAIVHRRPNEQFWVSLPFDAFVTLFDAMRKAMK